MVTQSVTVFHFVHFSEKTMRPPSLLLRAPRPAAEPPILTPGARPEEPVSSPSILPAPAGSRRPSPDADSAGVESSQRLPRPRGTPAPTPEPKPAVTRREPLARMRNIHYLLLANRSRLLSAEELSKDLEICPRTVKRDMATMQHALCLPIESKPGRCGGYRYTRGNVEFAAAPATSAELLALAIAAKLVRPCAGTRLEEGVRGVLQRLRLDVRPARPLDLDALGAALSFRGTGFDVLPDPDLLQTVTLASAEGRELRFAYQGLDDEAPRERTAEPHRVFRHENVWYVRSRDVAIGQIRHFCLGRMKQVRPTGRRFVPPPAEEVEAALRRSLGAYSDGKPVRAVIRFRGRPARIIRQCFWHHSQKVRVVGPRETDLELHVNDAPDLLYFVLRWGRDAEVLRPASLRRKVLAEAQAIAARG